MAPVVRRAAMFVGALAATAAAVALPALATDPPLGLAPTYSSRKLGVVPAGEVPNAAAITRRIWAPGIDEGYVPQGLTVVGSDVYLGTYRSIEASVSRGPCRLYRIAMATGSVTAILDLPPACGHAGGIARGAEGRIWVVDTRTMFEIALSPGSAGALGEVRREVRIEAPLKGSFAAGYDGALWLGSYERQGEGRLWRVPLPAIEGNSIGAAQVTAEVRLPVKAQGAAFDAAGRLWIATSGATKGELHVVDVATGAVAAHHAMPAGLEDLSFDATGGLWSVSEAGSRRWSNWATHFPVVFRLDIARLR
jgi:sugar lactone lactonase YvrE